MIKFGIVGCGFIANKHVKAINDSVGAELVAVCDTVKEKMTPYIEEFGVKGFTDFEEMLNDESIEVICICTPSGFHKNLAIMAANANKHIIVEKPISMTIEDAESIIEAANNNNVKLSVVHPNRFRPAIMYVKDLFEQGKFGKISHANCIVNWNRNQEYYDQAPWRGTKEFDGGVLMNQAIHNLDLLLWFMGEPKEIFSMEATRLCNIEAEDVSCGTVRFTSGALATIQASTTVYPKNYEESLTFFGEKGTVKIGGANAIYIEHIDFEGIDSKEIGRIKEELKNDPWGTPGHQRIIEDMVESIKINKETAVTGKDGLQSIKLVSKMYESAEKGTMLTWN